MWRRWSTERPPWPVALRPFADEPLGSWLGRVAASYRITVEQLWCDAGLDERPISTSAGWLLAAGINRDDLRRLAARPRRSSSVCSLMAALVERNGAQANKPERVNDFAVLVPTENWFFVSPCDADRPGCMIERLWFEHARAP